MTNKMTFVIGYKTSRPENWDSISISERYESNWEATAFHRSGYWKKETIANLARKLGLIGEITVKHRWMDYSGKGRTTTIREMTITL